jgi:hypothetical protein
MGRADTRGHKRSRLSHKKKRAGIIPARIHSRTVWLEVELQAKLNQARQIHRVGHHAKVSAAEGSIRRSELRMVEEVEEFRAEFNIEPLGDRSLLEYGEVEIDDAFLSQSGIDTRFITEAVCRSISEATRVEPLTDSGNSATRGSLAATSDYIRPQPTSSQIQRCKRISLAIAYLYWEAALQRCYAIQSPARNCSTGETVQTGSIFLAFAEGLIKHIAYDHALRNIL